MRGRKVMGLSGKLQSGKDTLGEHLIRKEYTRVAFADRLKEGLAAMLGLTVEYINNNKDRHSDRQHRQPLAQAPGRSPG